MLPQPKALGSGKRRIAMESGILDSERDESIFVSLVKAYAELYLVGESSDMEDLDPEKTRCIQDFLNGEEVVLESIITNPLESIDLVSVMEQREDLQLTPYGNLSINGMYSRIGEDVIKLINEGASYNVIFVLGEVKGNPGNSHFVAARIFRDPKTKEIIVLHRDSIGGKIDREFEDCMINQLKGKIVIVNVEDQQGVMKQYDGTTCGLRVVASLAHGGLLDRLEDTIRNHGGLDNFVVSRSRSSINLSILREKNRLLRKLANYCGAICEIGKSLFSRCKKQRAHQK
jgi:hypothetical protein